MDEVDPTRAGASEAQQTILGEVPAEASPEAFSSDSTLFGGRKEGIHKSQPSQSSIAGAPPMASKAASKLKSAVRAHKRNQSTAENLFSLTMDLQKMHLEEQSSRAKARPSLTAFGQDPLNPRNDGDQLARNAANLMKRYKKPSAKDLDEANVNKQEQSLDEPPKVSAADRWKKLKTAVRTSDALHGTKKNDDEVLQESQKEEEEEEESEGSGEDGTEMSERTGRKVFRRFRKKVDNEFKDFEDWLKYKKVNLLSYIKIALFGLIIPLSGVAAILFYAVGNPPCGTASQCLERNFNITRNTTTKISSSALLGLLTTASTSWWLLFLARQVITFSLARATEAVLVDYLALRSRWCVRIFGPFVTLFLVQARGWPIILFCWGLTDFIMLYGKNRFAQHW